MDKYINFEILNARYTWSQIVNGTHSITLYAPSGNVFHVFKDSQGVKINTDSLVSMFAACGDRKLITNALTEEGIKAFFFSEKQQLKSILDEMESSYDLRYAELTILVCNWLESANTVNARKRITVMILQAIEARRSQLHERL